MTRPTNMWRQPHDKSTGDPLRDAAERARSVPTGAKIDEQGYSPEELEFLKAMDDYKRHHRRPYPTCCEVLAVLKTLGWNKPCGS